MCDPSFTFEQLNDTTLFDKLKPTTDDYVVGEILYIAAGSKDKIECLKVIEISEKFIKLRNLNNNIERKIYKEQIDFPNPRYRITLFRNKYFNKRKPMIEAINYGNREDPINSIDDYLSDPYTQREISQYLGGKKYKRKTKRTKRTNKTNRKKRTRRRR